jgi:hypothetical protein
MPRATVEIRGKHSTWGVDWDASQKQIDAMRQDGIEVGIIMNSIPQWVVELGYGPTRVWCFIQDIWNLKNPFWKS